MKIASSNLQMRADTTFKQEYVKQESLNVWTDSGLESAVPKDVVSISVEGLKTQTKAIESPKEEEMLADNDYLKLKLLEKMLTKMFGRKFEFNYVALDLKRIQNESSLQFPGISTPQSPQETPQAASREGWGLHYQLNEQFTESEQLTFQANGSVLLKDGRQIDFSVSLHMNRSFSQTFSLDLKAGDALKDPLVIDLDGQGISFLNQTMHFDLDLDGQKDDIPVLSKGNGYLVIDRNTNGILDDGSELFGPTTGHGFDELAVYDQDQNRWIDESDDIFKSLKIWVSDGDGKGQLIGISEAGIGAVYLGKVKSPYQFKDSENQSIAQLKHTGVYLTENGRAGIIQELDLRV